MKRIAVLPEGSVSHEAIEFLFDGEPLELNHFKLISDVFRAVDSGSVQYSVIPFENTIEGSVSLHMDWLVNEVDIPIQAEWVYPSIQNIIGHGNEFRMNDGSYDFSKITKIMSHPVAIPQCQNFIRQHSPDANLEGVNSTAEAVEIVKKNPGKGWVGIGTKLAARKHGLDIMAERVTDHDNNYTRFVLIGHEPVSIPRKADHVKTSLIVTLPEDAPGALHQVLSAFAWRKLNLTRLESRPTKKRLGSYYFYIDVVETVDSVLLTAAMAEIEALNCQVRVLGSYPCYTYPSPS
ncbi:prephenate dehydratase [Paenibacillus barcinonensis]|uniref:prephenate dehydratase n=1 Tax=Paenibacillus TaxID=44249 RepID=UPI001C0FB680|nr:MULTISPECIES: prephenate dehydratase [Paenibacillus]MBU5355762.1 prephenate dehydratase [Paenibacillus barcinonensis]MDM5276017.1 prephenate dehydratase [Paenibacillus silvae]